MKEQELCHLLALELGWDADLTNQVVNSVKQHALEDSLQGVDEIVQNYMTDSVKCQEAVQSFAQAQRKSILGDNLKVLKRNDPFADDALNPSGNKPPSHIAAVPSSDTPSQPPGCTGNIKNSRSFSSKVGGPSRSQTTSTSTASTGQASKTGKTGKKNSVASSKQAPAQVSGQSLTVKKGVVHKGGSKQIDPAHAAVAAFHSTVFNCLSCGKVYDVREKTTLALAVIRNGGMCTFCSKPLPQAAQAAAMGAQATTSGESSSNTVAARNTTASQPAGGDSGADSQQAEAALQEVSEGADRARAFAARLVEYDRSAARRTTVIDDQGDFFEIESNAWLTPEERENFKRQQTLHEDLERQRRDKVTVSIDLLGREVRVVQKESLDEHASFEVDEVRRQAAVAAAAARASIPEGGGTAVAAAEAVACGGDSSSQVGPPELSSAGANSAARAFQMRPNVEDEGAAPLFVPVNRMRAEKAGDSRSSSGVNGGGEQGSRSNGQSDGAVRRAAPQIEGWNDNEETTRGRGRSGKGRKGRRGMGENGGSGHGGRNSGEGGGGGRGRRGQKGTAGHSGEALVEEPGPEGGLRGVWRQRQKRQAMRVQDITREDIFDRFADDVRVLYSDTSAAETASCAS